MSLCQVLAHLGSTTLNRTGGSDQGSTTLMGRFLVTLKERLQAAATKRVGGLEEIFRHIRSLSSAMWLVWGVWMLFGFSSYWRKYLTGEGRNGGPTFAGASSTFAKMAVRNSTDLFTALASLVAMTVPTPTEMQACWEICRLHNNIGFWVVWLPTAWSIAMVYRAQPEVSAEEAILRALIYVPLCFGIKSLIMTIDDLLDHDIDALVERTKNRAIPRGAISLSRAWLFFGLQVVSGVYVATTILSKAALYTSMPAWPLYIIYPTCKRWTNLAPIPLGLMFNVGIFMGWSDLTRDGSIPWESLVSIYFGTCLWTITYETVYQHQDKIDDAKIGLNSPARLCGEHTIPICTATATGFLCLLTYGGILNGQGAAFHAGILVAGAVLYRSLAQTDIDKPEKCKAMFLTTPLIGKIILGGFVIDAVLHRMTEGVAL